MTFVSMSCVPDITFQIIVAKRERFAYYHIHDLGGTRHPLEGTAPPLYHASKMLHFIVGAASPLHPFLD